MVILCLYVSEKGNKSGEKCVPGTRRGPFLRSNRKPDLNTNWGLAWFMQPGRCSIDPALVSLEVAKPAVTFQQVGSDTQQTAVIELPERRE